jgi:hypothetical protein
MLSPEFRLLAACAIWPPSGRQCADIREIAGVVDWQQALAVAGRHRIEGLFYAGLCRAETDLPPAIRDALAAKASALALQSLAHAAEAARLQGLFQEAGIPVLFLKGASLAKLAYDTLAIRHAKDIDILVAPEHAEAALALIGRGGYRRIVPSPDLSPTLFRRYLDYAKECEFVHRGKGVQLELHWRLADNPALLAGLPGAADPQVVPIGGKVGLATLGTEDLFAYLCVHGASHGWSRLKWLADIGTLLAREDEAGITRLYRASEARGAGYATAQALMLCRQLFGTPLSPALARDFEASRRLRLLRAIALRSMAGGGAVELTDRAFGSTFVFLSAFLLGRGWRYYWSELRSRLMNIDDAEMLPLPAFLHGLYPVLRLPLWLLRRLRHGGRSYAGKNRTKKAGAA